MNTSARHVQLKSFFRILTSAGIAPVRTKCHKHLDDKPADAQIKEILGLLPLYNSLLYIVIIGNCTALEGFLCGPKDIYTAR
jgi:hypothetical protein